MSHLLSPSWWMSSEPPSQSILATDSIATASSDAALQSVPSSSSLASVPSLQTNSPTSSSSSSSSVPFSSSSSSFIMSTLNSIIHEARSWSSVATLLSPLMQDVNPLEAAVPDQQNANTLVIPPFNPNGPLKRLKTLAEVQAKEATIEVYIAEIHPKATKVACDAMKPLLPEEAKKINLAHLRRPCNYTQLPEHLQSRLCPPSFFEAITTKSRRKKAGNKTSFILLCASCLIDEDVLLDAITDAFVEPEYTPPPRLHRIPVPLFPPTSSEQAEKWSADYWPTSFKNNNPYGPHPGTIGRAEVELTEDGPLNADACMRLARLVAADGKECGMGQPIGVVIVERIPDSPARIVAVASDARFRGYTSCENDRDCGGRGNITAHAVMRAIGMVAQKRRIIDKKTQAFIHTNTATGATSPEPGVITVVEAPDPASPISPSLSADDDMVSCLAQLPSDVASTKIFLDVPITDREKQYFDPPTLASKGYLCLNLELYVTHEPCIMCSMAILHSRFGRVIFEKDMRTTGALVAQRDSIAPVIKTPEAADRSLPPTKSAKRRKSRKNSKIRAIQAAIQEEEIKSPPLEYGLWWRGQLNWKFLCWQWRQDRVDVERPTTAVTLQSNTSSDEDASKGSTSRRPSTAFSTPSAPFTTGNLADMVKSMTLSSIPQSVHI